MELHPILRQMDRRLIMDLCSIPPRWLVFAGGGMKGISYIGALEELQARSMLTFIRGVAGVSIGSLFAAAIALGYTIEELKNECMGLDFAALQNFNEETLFDVFDTYGVDDGANLRRFLCDLLAKKGHGPGLRFKDLKGSAELRIYACRLDNGVVTEFSARATPAVPIVDAIMASMAIPLYFRPVIIGGLHYIDGGVTNNYPIGALSPTEQRYALGFVFLKNRPLFHAADTDRNHFGAYVQQLIRIMGMDRYRAQLKLFEKRTVLIDTGATSVLEFSLTDDSKKILIAAGRNAVAKFYSGRRSVPMGRRYSIA
jgi:predicted acylesterase/phospholipase RssA